jgi:hypothetical protein
MLHDRPVAWMEAQIPPIDADPELQHPDGDDLADVFGSEPGTPSSSGYPGRDGGNTEWSDIPRLKEKHETEGYRDGVTKGKAESVQGGFDEGYGLGAVIGLRVGKILGLLEGIHAAARSTESIDTGDEWKVEGERLESLLGLAKAELKTESVFGREYFGEDGIWRFAVEVEGEGREVVFPDIAGSHPLIQKWEDVVAGEVRKWDLDLTIMENEQEEDAEQVALVKDSAPGRAAHGSRKELNW